MLATGDSEIQVLDDQIASALSGRARVIGEAHISTGLSKLGFFNWIARATTQALSIHPDVTIMSIGANDGFGLPGVHGGTAQCCGADWVDGLRRAGAPDDDARTCATGRGACTGSCCRRRGRPNFAPVYRAVDAGFLAAARQFPAGVHVVDIRPIFSPGGRYRQFVGSVDARESDGIHLSAAGDQIALRFLLAQMRADGTL